MLSIRKFTVFSLLIFSLILLSSTVGFAQKPLIFVSILPQKYFVEQIAGDTVDVEVMVAPGASPATYEPRPRQMAMLAKADVYLAIGVPFERTWLPRIAATNPNLKIVHIDKGLRKLPMVSSAIAIDKNPHGEILQDFRSAPDSVHTKADHSTYEHKEDHKHSATEKHEVHSHKGILDPHVWLSPRWVKAMTKNIRRAIGSAAPQHAKQYRINTRKFNKRLDELDEEISLIFQAIPADKRVFMTFHPSWGYYAMTYNLIQFPIEFEGKAPTPKILVEISKIAKKRNLRTIFVQPQFSTQSADAIAQSINGNVVVADSLAENWEENLRTVSKKLATSFIFAE